jgi:hypothetical protein
LIEEEISEINEIKGLDELTDLQELRLQYNNISEIKGLEKLTNLQVLELQNNHIEVIKGLENLTKLTQLNLYQNPVYEPAKKKFGGTKFLTGEFKSPELLVKFCQDKVESDNNEPDQIKKITSLKDSKPSLQMPTKAVALKYVQDMITEKKLLEKFKNILEMAPEVKKDEVATSLGISKAELFENLLKWKKNLPFVLKGDLIIVHDMNDFKGKLDQQFDSWGKGGQVASNGPTFKGPIKREDIPEEKMYEYKKLLEDEQKIRMVFVIHKESGGMLLNQFYGLEDLDDKSDLITGFLTTVSQWGQEVHSSSDGDALSLLSWKNFHIHLERGDHIMLAVVCDDPLTSNEIHDRILNLINKVEIEYQKELQRFTGNIKPFEGIVSIIDDTLKAVHQFPCKIDLDKLKQASISTGIKQFLTTQSYKKNKFYVMDVIQKLIDVNIVSPEIEVYKEIYTLLDSQIICKFSENPL